ncbi:unnamed protein product [marine sediment metagenome]|uniref:Uncharacterized protein n=1 Tax=marine sediment metagenome TaxID=412755 RepID=X1IY60_9ZZZZ
MKKMLAVWGNKQKGIWVNAQRWDLVQPAKQGCGYCSLFQFINHSFRTRHNTTTSDIIRHFINKYLKISFSYLYYIYNIYKDNKQKDGYQ